MHKLLVGILLAAVAQAHVVSMSSGEVHVTGRAATYELRMPAYEITHVADPAAELLDQITFTGAIRKTAACRLEDETYHCTATYEFVTEIRDKLEVECTLFKVTVPNHIHILYAVQGANSDQVVFDQTNSRREMRFHPVTFTETISRDGGAGAFRFLSSFAAILFIGVLILAARTPREVAILAIGFLASEFLIRPVVPYIQVGLSPDFLEALLALTVAYMAAEVFFLPDGKARWLVVPLLGLAHGLPFAGFPVMYTIGAATTQTLLIAVLAVPIFHVPSPKRRTIAAIFAVIAVAWFTNLLMK